MICKTIPISIRAKDYDPCGQSPTLTAYCLTPSEHLPDSAARPAMVICPGGGYAFVSAREAEPIAFEYLALGFNCFVLNYSVAPARFPTALLELAYSVAYLRDHAAEFCIHPDKIAVVGFSAGGHLAASLGVFWDRPFVAEPLHTASASVKPNATVLAYPVITSGTHAHQDSFRSLLGDSPSDKQLEFLSLEKMVGGSTAPAFLWHTLEDDLVPVENTLLYANALQRHKVPFELHIYPRGGHGLSLASEITGAVMPDCQDWAGLSARWLRTAIFNKGA